MAMPRPDNVVQVGSLDHADLLPYRTLRRPESHVQQGIFVAEGDKVVRRLELDRTARGDTRIFVGERDLLSQIVGFNLHQGVMAVGRVPSEPDLAELPSPHMVVALDSLRMSENVGTIVRNCAAFAVDAVLVGETSCSPFMRRAVRNSMGSVFDIPVIHSLNLAASLESLTLRFGTKIMVTDPHAPLAVYDADLTGSLCLVLGKFSELGGKAPDA
jgi:tRNA G18 (ribose-2'-O)-methylase SpoU